MDPSSDKKPSSSHTEIRNGAPSDDIAQTDKDENSSHEQLESSPPKQREKILRADQRYNKQKRKTEYLKSASTTKRMHRFSKYVILVRTIIGEKGVPVGKEIDIKGKLLQQALNEINKDVEGFTIDPAAPEIDKHIFFHSKDRLAKMLVVAKMAESPDTDLIFELEAGVEFLNDEFATDIASFQTLAQERTITFSLLWMLFPHGSLFVSRDEFKQYWAANVQAFHYGRHPMTEEKYFKVWYNYVDHDGSELGTRTGRFEMKEFSDKMTFDSLSHQPLSLHPEVHLISDILLKQGRKALSFHGRRLIEYQGTALRKVERDQDRVDQYGYPIAIPEPQMSQFNSHGRVMLDPETWQQVEPEDGLVPRNLLSMKTRSITEKQTMIITPKLYGFSLRNKIWGVFACSQLKEVEWDMSVFEALVLDQEQKGLIRDLVEAHALNDITFDDFVQSKGKGLVGLLTGPPGVGKTMTAEAIAEVAKRPLYVLGSGELGDRIQTIHQTLKHVMELAELWDAVVLLDEADTFLCHRSATDLSQNAVASIFLRELEYYRGILILTTNRLMSIDDAFQSRIHFHIQYPDLNQEGRRSIWHRYLERAVLGRRCTVDIDKQGYDTLAALELNGREIKNIMSISQTIAMRRNKSISVASIRSTMRLCQDMRETRLSRKDNGDIFDVLSA